MTGFRRRYRTRALASTLAAVVGLALVALAGPAAANDGHHDRDDGPAGTIASYDGDSGTLTIDLADGGSISGVVTGRTWIEDGDDHGCDRDGSKAQRQVRKALHGDWCDERGRHGDHGDGDHHHGWRHGPSGDESDLVEGAVVEGAILVLKDGRAWFAKVELED
jgi:hypothetical protein